MFSLRCRQNLTEICTPVPAIVAICLVVNMGIGSPSLLAAWHMASDFDESHFGTPKASAAPHAGGY